MKWHKIKKCLPPEDAVVLIHVEGYQYAVGQLASCEDEAMKFGFIPWDDVGAFLEVSDCLAWARFDEKDRSPLEPKAML